MANERDKGYAWIVATSSSFIMFIGPSTFTCYGSIVEGVEMNYNYRSWILTLMYICMLASAITIGPLIHVKCTFRKIALAGCFLTAGGFLLTSVILNSTAWFFLTLSTLVGTGFGLAIHATFLIVTFHFTRYRGLANGIGLVSAGAGYLLSPLMYESIESVKDKLHLRALVSAVAFMAASFYVSPLPLLAEKPPLGESAKKGMGAVGMTRNRPGKPSIPSMMTVSPPTEEDNNMRHEEFPRESIPLVEKDMDEIPPSHLLRPRRPSQFMAAIAGTLLPNIPEESESQEPSIQTLEMSTSNNSSDNSSMSTPTNNNNTYVTLSSPSSPLREEMRADIGKHMSHLDLEVRLSKAISNNTDASQSLSTVVEGETEQGTDGFCPAPITKVSSSPSLRQNHYSTTTKYTTTGSPETKSASTPIKKLSYSQFRRAKNVKPSTNNKTSSTRTQMKGKSGSLTHCSSEPKMNLGEKPSSITGNLLKFMDLLNVRLLQNPSFLNMAFGCSLTMIILPNFPIVLYAHVVHSTAADSNYRGLPYNDGGEFVLIIIFLLDLLSRLVSSYLSDFSFFNRRLGFLLGSVSSAAVILCIGFVQDVRVIYVLAIMYGISFGILASTESLMFADAFGIDQLSSSYGFVGLFKAVLVAITSFVLQSPSTAFLYTVHPILHPKVNGTICTNCDPLDLFSTSRSAEQNLAHRQYLFRLIAFPVLVSAIMWSFELLFLHIQQRRKCEEKAGRKSNSSPQV